MGNQSPNPKPGSYHGAPDRDFVARHIGPTPADIDTMLEAIGVESLNELIEAAVPPAIRQQEPLDLAEASSETEVIARLRDLASQNTVTRSLIGMGYYDTVTPPVIRRNILENPAWYTAYTPYQPEISQGRLEALLNFQTVVSDLCGLDLANASMLDEGTAAAEAMTMCHRISKAADGAAFFIDADCHPQTIAVVSTRAEPLGIPVVIGDPEVDLAPAIEGAGVFGALFQYPGSSGRIADPSAAIDSVHIAGGLAVVATDLLALTMLASPGDLNADIAVGSSQRFGVPMGFGGPHAGFLATHEDHRRSLPGRLVGMSVDEAGRPALRLALQTREQHIRRDKATSNICTAQVLLAVIAAMYAAYHGPEGLTAIAQRVHGHAATTAAALTGAGFEVVNSTYFDTITVATPGRADEIVAAALAQGFNLRRVDDDHIGLSFDETTTDADVAGLLAAFDAPPLAASDASGQATAVVPEAAVPEAAIPEALVRLTGFMEHPVFHRYRSETEMLRYLRQLSDKDVALDRSMIPLGSCTMKLNATTEMEAITWPEFAGIHPFAPTDQTTGYRTLIDELEAQLVEITGYDAVSLQPNAGSQGEFAGLLAIRRYHDSRGDDDRTVCLIPSSAHGTNAASAVMAGMEVVAVDCDDDGNVDVADLEAKVAKVGDTLAALMITYPSTHGVFETAIPDICATVHDNGCLLYTSPSPRDATLSRMPSSA